MNKITEKDITIRIDPMLNYKDGKVTIITETKIFPDDIRRYNIDEISSDIHNIVRDKLIESAHLADVLQTNKQKKIIELQKEIEWLKK